MPKKLENPPDDKDAEVSFKLLESSVAPTLVTLERSWHENSSTKGSLRYAYKGQLFGNVGMNVLQPSLSPNALPATPPSPEEKRIETPRAPSCA